MLRSRLLGGCLLWALATSASAQPAIDWLARMGEALRTVDYQGTLVYVDGQHMETLRVFRSAADDRERLVALTGRPREIVRHGQTVTCIGTAPDPLVIDSGTLSGLGPVAAAASSGALTEYAISLGGVNERIAGREVVAVHLKPRDRYRYGYKFWLDADTGLPLRMSLLAASGEMLEQIAFAEVSIGQRPAESDLRPSGPGMAVADRPLPPATAAVPPTTWTVREPPSGFTLRRAQKRDDGEHLVYSDGLASVSVYVEPLTGEPASDATMRAGALHARTLHRDGVRIYAIGKVPAVAVDRIASGVVRRAAGSDG